MGTMPFYFRAYDFAQKAHAGQFRRYTDAPYFDHLVSVAGLVGDHTQDEEVLAAAVLHDILEDTKIGFDELQRMFGARTAGIVAELTDEYTKAAYPGMSRALRKDAERDRLSRVSAEAKLIKWADLTDNTPSIMRYDPEFAKVYLFEVAELYSAIKS